MKKKGSKIIITNHCLVYSWPGASHFTWELYMLTERWHSPVHRGKERNDPHCEGGDEKNRNIEEVKIKRGICGRAGAHCRVPAHQCLIWKIIFLLVNSDLSNKILCMFTFNSSSFRKDSILLGTTSVWAGLDLLGAKDALLFLNQALPEADAIDRLPL